MKHPTQILKHPVVTEKGTMMADQHKVLFAVDRHANKREIKRAVEDLYKVKVLRVHTAIRPGKLKRVRIQAGYKPDEKRAVVTLAPGSKIDVIG